MKIELLFHMKTWFWEKSLHVTHAPCQRLKSLYVLKSTIVDPQTVFLCGTHLREKKEIFITKLFFPRDQHYIT